MVCSKSRCKSAFQRARQPEQKEQRKAEILAAAALLLERDGFDKVSLNGIAREAGVAKSNIYRYYESREDIFLQLLQEDWKAWLDNIEQALAPFEGSNNIDDVTILLAKQVEESPRMCQLMSVLASVLENNISEELLLSFKLESVQLGLRMISTVQKSLPDIKQENMLPAAHSIIALIAGLWPLANPSPMVEKVMDRPELVAFKMEFGESIKHSLRLIIRGAY
ncbi:MAG: TetR/AcrR family transcriptional regulator [Pseudomonadales bacterium]|nr:TetR/AcrR family transcriptional regulator [Pseudomonadales bacterium]